MTDAMTQLLILSIWLAAASKSLPSSEFLKKVIVAVHALIIALYAFQLAKGIINSVMHPITMAGRSMTVKYHGPSRANGIPGKRIWTP